MWLLFAHVSFWRVFAYLLTWVRSLHVLETH